MPLVLIFVTEYDVIIIVAGLIALINGLTIIVICYGLAKVIDNQDKFELAKEQKS